MLKEKYLSLLSQLVLRQLGIEGTPFEKQQIMLACQAYVEQNPSVVLEDCISPDSIEDATRMAIVAIQYPSGNFKTHQ